MFLVVVDDLENFVVVAIMLRDNDFQRFYSIEHDFVHLFFLFDASASQFSQISAMVRSAEEIVKMFAGEGPDAKNVCNVGSALFLGPKIKLMCSQ